MQGLLLRLSTLDSDAESAVRVIAYFDSLVRDHASVPALLAATARLAQCPVGLYDAGAGKHTRALPGGRTDHPDAITGSAADAGADTVGGSVTGSVTGSVRQLGSGLGAVWMEREGPAHGLDEIVLERFATTAEVTLERAATRVREGHDPALVELALSAETGAAERARALRLMGFDPSVPLQAMAMAVPEGSGQTPLPALRAMGHRVRAARIGDTDAVLVASAITPLPEAVRVGIGPELPGSRAAESWAGARTALLFTGPHDLVVRHDELGALALYAGLPGAAIAGLADVRAMEGVGDEARAAVRALCLEGSVRRAATAMHLHHSSMAARVARAEALLGFSLHDPAGRLRAHLALTLVRLHANLGDRDFT